MLSDRTSTILHTLLSSLPPTAWHLVVSDQADHVVGVAVIDVAADDDVAYLWDIEGHEIAQVPRSTPIHVVVETLLRAHCSYVR
jgi:hypothetical protein